MYYVGFETFIESKIFILGKAYENNLLMYSLHLTIWQVVNE